MKVITLIMLLSFKAMALDPLACNNALNACIDLSKKQDDSIAYCKQEINALEGEIVSQDNKATRDTILYTVVGFLAGGLLVRVFTK